MKTTNTTEKVSGFFATVVLLTLVAMAVTYIPDWGGERAERKELEAEADKLLVDGWSDAAHTAVEFWFSVELHPYQRGRLDVLLSQADACREKGGCWPPLRFSYREIFLSAQTEGKKLVSQGGESKYYDLSERVYTTLYKVEVLGNELELGKKDIKVLKAELQDLRNRLTLLLIQE